MLKVVIVSMLTFTTSSWAQDEPDDLPSLVVEDPVLILETGTIEAVSVEQGVEEREPEESSVGSPAQIRSICLSQLGRAINASNLDGVFAFGEISELAKVEVEFNGRRRYAYEANFTIREAMAGSRSNEVQPGQVVRLRWFPRPHNFYSPSDGRWLLTLRSQDGGSLAVADEEDGRRHWPLVNDCLEGWGVCLADIRALGGAR